MIEYVHVCCRWNYFIALARKTVYLKLVLQKYLFKLQPWKARGNDVNRNRVKTIIECLNCLHSLIVLQYHVNCNIIEYVKIHEATDQIHQHFLNTKSSSYSFDKQG